MSDQDSISLCIHIVDRARDFSGATFIKALMTFMKILLLWPNQLPKAQFSNTITLRLSFNTRVLRWHKPSDRSIPPLLTKIPLLLACKIHLFYPNSPQSLNWFQHQFKSVSPKPHLNIIKSNMCEAQIISHFKANCSLATNLWNQTCYVLPKYNDRTGIG